MAPRADRMAVLTDSGKFSQVGVVTLGLDLSRVTVVTDAGIPSSARSSLEAGGAQVIIA